MKTKLPAVIPHFDINQPEPLAEEASLEESNKSDLEHVDATFDIAYHALQVASKTHDFCAVIKALQTSIGLRRQILGHDSKGKVSPGGKRTVELLS